MTDPNGVAPAPASNPTRRRAFRVLGLVVVVCAIGWGVYNFVFTRDSVSTDDAYVSGDVIQVTSEIPGTVIALHVDDTQTVTAGQPLLELDPADAKIAMASAQAGLAQAVRRVKSLQAQADQLRAQVDARQADVLRAADDAQRRAKLIATGAVSREDFAHAQDVSAVQVAALAAARAQLEETIAELGTTSIATNPDVLTAAARLKNAALGLRRTQILAPADGVIAKRGVQIGQHVDSGTPLLALVPLQNVWIDANFKEVQLQDMRIGQRVKIRTDLYGGKVVYDGKVAGISAGSGNAFALLPAQNATGNWIKIVQRLPVRILIDREQLKKNPLRIGLSADVDVDVGDKSGPLIATEVRGEPFPAKPSDGNDPAIDLLIAKIIADNGGGSPEIAAAKTP
jgi:membrane fusion protein (multidrug efflux system)